MMRRLNDVFVQYAVIKAVIPLQSVGTRHGASTSVNGIYARRWSKGGAHWLPTRLIESYTRFRFRVWRKKHTHFLVGGDRNAIDCLSLDMSIKSRSTHTSKKNMYQTNCNYYDTETLKNIINGQVAPLQDTPNTAGKTFWDKSWRLFAAVGCFVLAALSAWLLWWLISDDSIRSIPVIAFILPFYIIYLGVRLVVKFFIHLFKSNVQTTQSI